MRQYELGTSETHPEISAVAAKGQTETLAGDLVGGEVTPMARRRPPRALPAKARPCSALRDLNTLWQKLTEMFNRSFWLYCRE